MYVSETSIPRLIKSLLPSIRKPCDVLLTFEESSCFTGVSAELPFGTTLGFASVLDCGVELMFFDLVITKPSFSFLRRADALTGCWTLWLPSLATSPFRDTTLPG